MSSSQPTRQTASFAAFNDQFSTICPISSDGTPNPDPEARWETARQAWLAPRPGAAAGRKEKDPVVAARLRSLESMLRVGKPAAVVQEVVEVQQQEEVRGGTSTESGVAAATGDKGKRKEASLDELEPDGGMVIREKPGDELRRASESILLAFKQSRPLKEALPLSLVTSLLYRSWELDGTIPSDYRPPPSAPAFGDVPPSRPSLSRPTTTSAAPSPTLSATSTPPPLPPVEAMAPKLEGMGGSAEADGRMKVDMLRGSRWRTEKEIASGSDVI